MEAIKKSSLIATLLYSKVAIPTGFFRAEDFDIKLEEWKRRVTGGRTHRGPARHGTPAQSEHSANGKTTERTIGRNQVRQASGPAAC